MLRFVRSWVRIRMKRPYAVWHIGCWNRLWSLWNSLARKDQFANRGLLLKSRVAASWNCQFDRSQRTFFNNFFKPFNLTLPSNLSGGANGKGSNRDLRLTRPTRQRHLIRKSAKNSLIRRWKSRRTKITVPQRKWIWSPRIEQVCPANLWEAQAVHLLLVSAVTAVHKWRNKFRNQINSHSFKRIRRSFGRWRPWSVPV